jgi:hypothetical protein
MKSVLPFQMSRRDAKRNYCQSPLILETRKGVPTNWAGTPDAHHLERPIGFAKPLFAQIHCETGGKTRF